MQTISVLSLLLLFGIRNSSGLLQRSDQCEVRVVSCEDKKNSEIERSALLTGKQGIRGPQGLVGPPGPPGRACNDSYVNELQERLTGLEMENVVIKGQLDLLINCKPPKIEHATTPRGKVLHGEHIRYTCDEGYSTSNRTNRKCRKGEVVPTFEREPLVCYPESCHVVKLNDPLAKSGTYQIKQQSSEAGTDEFYCEIDDEQGWTLIQRRMDGRVSFNQNWEEYKQGFGSLDSEYWIGLDHMHKMTDKYDQKLRIDMINKDNQHFFAIYNFVYIGDERSKYSLTVDGYTGDAGDGLYYSNSQAFSTKNSDNDRHSSNCASKRNYGWWFWNCGSYQLNEIPGNGYFSFPNTGKLKSVTMKIGKR